MITYITLDSGVSRGVSILIRNDISSNKINLNINLQVVAAKATLHRTINIYSL